MLSCDHKAAHILIASTQRWLLLQLMPRVIQGGMEESFLYKKSRFTCVLTTYPLYAVVHKAL